MTAKKKILGVFTYFDDLLNAIKALKKEGVAIDNVYSPTARHEILSLMELPLLSKVRFFTLAGAITGVFTAIGLVIYTAVQWNLIVSGKPVVPTVPTVIVAFELLILFGILFTMFGWLFKSRLPRFTLPSGYDVRFSDNRFGILVSLKSERPEEVSILLKEAGAEEIHEIDE